MNAPQTPQWLFQRQWLPLSAPLTTGSLLRLQVQLQRVVEQFQVETAPRYKASPGVTWCNIFGWDVTRALACEIPFVVKKGDAYCEQSANDMHDWLYRHGAANGWQGCVETEAAAWASAGRPLVVTHRAADGHHGHIAVGVPTPAGAVGVYVAQAGRVNFSCGALFNAFGALPRTFWRHA